MATVDNSTQLIVSTESGTGWSVDVTNANLDPDLTLKDFIVLFDDVVQNNVDFTKTSQTIITYNGAAIGSTLVTIRRDTPNERVKCLTYGDRLQSAEYEAEFNRVHKLINENALGTSGGSVTLPAVVRLDAPGTNIFLDATVGNDITGDGFTTPIQTVGRLQEILETYNFESQSVTVSFSNYTGGDTLNGTGVYGIDALTLNMLGNTLTSNFGLSGFVNISSITLTGGTFDDAVLQVNSIDTFLNILSTFQNHTTGSLVELTTIRSAIILPLSLLNLTVTNGVTAIGVSLLSTTFNVIVASTFTNAAVRFEAENSNANFIFDGSANITGKKYDIDLLSTYVTVRDLSSGTESVASTFPDNTAINGSDYDNTISGLTATTQKTAIDEIASAAGSSLVNQDINTAIDITVTPGVSNDRLFITPTANINLILLTAGATNTTHFTFVNLDPGTFTIDIKIDLVGNPTILTLGGAINNVSVGYTGTDYRFYG